MPSRDEIYRILKTGKVNEVRQWVKEQKKKGSSVDILDQDNNSVLHWAVAYGECEIVSILLRNRANPNIQNRFGMTPLHWSVSASLSHDYNTKIIHLLLRYGANINLRNIRGENPADYGEKIGAIELSKKLQQLNNLLSVRSSPLATASSTSDDGSLFTADDVSERTETWNDDSDAQKINSEEIARLMEKLKEKEAILESLMREQYQMEKAITLNPTPTKTTSSPKKFVWPSTDFTDFPPPITPTESSSDVSSVGYTRTASSPITYCEDISPALSCQPSSYEIYITECMKLNIKPNSIILRVLNRKPGVHNLIILDCSNNFLGDTGVLALLPVIQINKQLQSICFPNNGVTSATVHKLCYIVEEHDELFSLDLSNNKLIHSEAGLTLLHMAATHPSLHTILLMGTNISTKMIRRIQSALRSKLL